MSTKRHKYNAKSTVVDGFKFPSKAEADYYFDLKRLHKLDGVILQEKFLLTPPFEKLGKKYKEMSYISDFYFQDHMTVVDIKGFETPVFKLKQKLFDFNFKDYKLVTLTRCPKWLMNELRTDVRWIESGKLKKLRKLKGSNKKFHTEINMCVVDNTINAII